MNKEPLQAMLYASGISNIGDFDTGYRSCTHKNYFKGTSSKSFRNFKWSTADGRSIKVKDMDDTHLHNCLLYLDRQICCYETNEYESDWMYRLKKAKVAMELERKYRELPTPLFSIQSIDYIRKQLKWNIK